MANVRKLHVSVQPEQAGVVPYRVREGAVEFLLVTSRRKGRWIVPKGKVEKELGPHESARREAFEEAGVGGPMGPEPVGCYRHGGSRKSPVVELYLMRVERERDEWPEDDARQRAWVPAEEARERVSKKGLASLLGDVAALLRLAAGRGHPALPRGEDGEPPE